MSVKVVGLERLGITAVLSEARVSNRYRWDFRNFGSKWYRESVRI